MITLDKFLATQRSPRSAYVKYQGFKDLYVRKSPVYIQHTKTDNFVTIANVTASRPGNGAFGELLIYLQEELHKNVAVECIRNERLLAKLLREGFQYYAPRDPSVYRLWM